MGIAKSARPASTGRQDRSSPILFFAALAKQNTDYSVAA